MELKHVQAIPPYIVLVRVSIHSPVGMESMPTQNVWYPRSHLSQNIISSSWWGCWHTVQVLHSIHCQRYVWITHTSSSLMSKQDGWPKVYGQRATCTEANMYKQSQKGVHDTWAQTNMEASQTKTQKTQI